MAEIKETTDVIYALRTVFEQGKKIIDDKRFTMEDLSHVAPAYEALKQAKEGSSEIPGEIRDLDASEVRQLLSDLLDTGISLYELIQGLARSKAPIPAQSPELSHASNLSHQDLDKLHG